MKKANMSVNEIIDMIEVNKHDITMRLRRVVLDPISAMIREGAATSIYYSENANSNKKIKEQATHIMNLFCKKWRNQNSTDDEQLSQMLEMIRKVNEEIILQIKEIVEYYKYCIVQKHYFAATESGTKALQRMTKAVNNSDGVCKDLLRLDSVESDDNKNIQKYCLLELLQEYLDDIDAEVIYVNECNVFSFQILIDKEKFQNHVLINISNNIQNHAFGTQDFANKPLWEKEVNIDIKDVNNNYIITIKNNGEVYKGDSSRIFDYGYCYGKLKNNGIGMHSARKSMKELGGSIEFISTPNDKYHVSLILTIPKNGNKYNI